MNCANLVNLFPKYISQIFVFVNLIQGHTKLSSAVPSTLHVAVKAKRSSQFRNSDLCRPHLNGLGHLQRRAVVSVSVTNSQKHSESAVPFIPFRDDDVSVEKETCNIQKLNIDDAENERIGKENEKSDENSIPPQSQFSCDEDSIWYICTHAVKGLKPRQI